jgi:endonuclease YncB( thermonuclease family)
MRKKRRLDWLQGVTPRKRRPSIPKAVPLVLATGALMTIAVISLPIPQWLHRSPGPGQHSHWFWLCFTGGGWNCVVDGDTFWDEGADIRIADIDAPETHPPRCKAEAELGRRATLRLQQLLDGGSFTLQSIDRDEDIYHRKLRIVMRDGRSLGTQLVDEGLARPWTGARRPWC